MKESNGILAGEKKSPLNPELTVKEVASMGGKARAKKLSRKRRCEISKKALAARWAKKR